MSADYDRLFGPPEPEGPDEAAGAADRPGRPMHNGHNVSAATDIAQRTGQVSPSQPDASAAAAMPMNTPRPRPTPPAKPMPTPPGRHARHRRASDPTPEQARSAVSPAPQPKAARRGAATHHRAVPQRRPPANPPAAQQVAPPANYDEPTRRLPTRRGAPAAANAKLRPQRGWRRWVYLLTRINVGPSRDEKYELDLHARITRGPRRTYQIGVLGLQGGAGKTTLTVILGSAFADVRGGRVLAIDADPAAGNLADRVGRTNRASIADLTAAHTGPRYTDIRPLTSTNAVNLDVLAAAPYGAARRGLSQADWRCAARAAAGAYDVVLADCGGDFFAPATRAVLSTVNAIVLVAAASADGARQAAVAIDWLKTNGYRRLLTRAHVVIDQVLPGQPPAQMADMVREFDRTLAPGRVVALPYDRHIAAGGAIAFASLDDTYRRRTLELAADLADDFNKVVRPQ